MGSYNLPTPERLQEKYYVKTRSCKHILPIIKNGNCPNY